MKKWALILVIIASSCMKTPTPNQDFGSEVTSDSVDQSLIDAQNQALVQSMPQVNNGEYVYVERSNQVETLFPVTIELNAQTVANLINDSSKLSITLTQQVVSLDPTSGEMKSLPKTQQTECLDKVEGGCNTVVPTPTPAPAPSPTPAPAPSPTPSPSPSPSPTPSPTPSPSPSPAPKSVSTSSFSAQSLNQWRAIQGLALDKFSSTRAWGGHSFLNDTVSALFGGSQNVKSTNAGPTFGAQAANIGDLSVRAIMAQTQSTNIHWTFHNLAVTQTSVPLPSMVNIRSDCGGRQGDCGAPLAATQISWDQVDWTSESYPVKYSFNLLFSKQVPFFATVLMSCVTTTIPFNQQRISVMQCENVRDFTFGQTQ